MSTDRPLTAARAIGYGAVAFAVLIVTILIAASLGAVRINLLDLLGASDVGTTAILRDVRLPRVLLAAMLGGALSLAGVVFQALLRNPLADPYVLGVSGGASLGNVIAVFVGLGGSSVLLAGFARPAAALVGAFLTLLLIERIATVAGRMTVYTVLLTGAIFNAFSAALIYFLQSIASLDQLHAIVFSLMGRVPNYGYTTLGVILIVLLIPTLLLFASARDYNALSLGEDGAAQLGVDVERLKRKTLFLGALLTAIAVSVAGMIGFVGLVVPHLLRLWRGPDHRLLIPLSVFGGATFLVIADLGARLFIAPGELPVGVVTALIGGPFFLYLLRRWGARHHV
ncbi:MAG: iron ABC transporter permease [Acidobacteriota bacterium]|nr:iron ABC transporter permease [Acidobacteriota bacterium]MDH3784072.1 iron ABC transporter permease [Acidobacteriota bacterium]